MIFYVSRAWSLILFAVAGLPVAAWPQANYGKERCPVVLVSCSDRDSTIRLFGVETRTPPGFPAANDKEAGASLSLGLGAPIDPNRDISAATELQRYTKPPADSPAGRLNIDALNVGVRVKF